jgi:hypothetical protein
MVALDYAQPLQAQGFFTLVVAVAVLNIIVLAVLAAVAVAVLVVLNPTLVQLLGKQTQGAAVEAVDLQQSLVLLAALAS